MKDKKQFALDQIKEYWLDPSKCGYDDQHDECEYLTSDGKMCVLGKNLLHPENYEGDTSGLSVLDFDKTPQSEILKPEAADILTCYEWTWLQNIHDQIARTGNQSFDKFKEHDVWNRDVSLFTYQDLLDLKA